MKKINIVPNKENKEWRFRWYHVLICCLLITTILVSMSVGMGYAKFVRETDPLELAYTVTGRQLKFPGYIVAKRVPGVDTVLVSEDGNFKVTVPADATGEGLDGAEYLLLKITDSAVNFDQYQKDSQQNSISYSALLQSYSSGVEADNYPFVNDDNGSISVELKVGHDAVDFVNVTPDTAPDYDAESGFLKFTGIDSITDQNGTFAAEFDRSTITPDTSLFDDYDNVDTFIITTPAQLAGLAKMVNEEGKSFEGKTIMLGDDISLYNQDNSKYTWDPIGNSSNAFRGSFNGDGHTISGLNLRVFKDNPNDATLNTCGLFGIAAGSNTTFENVTLKDVSYAADMGVNSDPEDGQSFGALIGYSHGVEISNVHVDGLNVYGKAQYMGGILGRGDSEGSIHDCSVENGAFNVMQAGYAGGIVGLQYGNAADMLRNCYVDASFSGDYKAVGGIVGFGFGQNDAMGVENSYFIGTFAPTEDSTKCGGIVGMATSNVNQPYYTINNCYSDCNAELFGYGYFGYHVYAINEGEDGHRSLDEESVLLSDRIVIANSSWSGENDPFVWSSYYIDETNGEKGSAAKSDECWFTAGMTYQQYLDALRAHGEAPEVPTEPPTEAPTEPPTEAPTDVYATEQYETPIH